MTAPARSTLVPVILSGGTGTRLWPMSRRGRPKQLLPMLGDRTLLQATAERFADGARFAHPLVVCGVDHARAVRDQLAASGRQARPLLLEPAGRNTAPAAAVAALQVAAGDPDAVMALLPADHHIADPAAFLATLALARTVAAAGYLVTFGIRPTRPETGYGYIRAGEPLPDLAALAVAGFVEKPALPTARQFLADGGYFWNSGMFVFRAGHFLAELGRLQPGILAAATAALERAAPTADGLLLDAVAFGACPSLSIDHAVMEHTRQAAMVPGDFGWSDIGSWSALAEQEADDGSGNVIRGEAIVLDVTNSYIRRTDGPLVAAIGLRDIVIVSTADAVLVLPKARDQEVKAVLDELNRTGLTALL